VIEYVELAKREGGRVLCGGEIPADPPVANRLFFHPTIMAGVQKMGRGFYEYFFGPVVVGFPFGD
ncbi:aldehyde dehydrogenase family protein, partial [Enterobacter intestinihominis]